MKVYVIGRNGLGLAPTTPRKARILLSQKKAEIIYRQPFTIRLHYKTGCAHNAMRLGVDTGSQNIGFSVVSEDCGTVLSKEEYKLRSSMEKRSLLETRRQYRRGRRYRKVRYRHPKFHPETRRTYKNEPVRCHKHLTHWEKETGCFNSSRLEGWLPPSIQSKLDHHVRLISRYRAALPPGTKIRIEVGRFDVPHMKDPTVRGEMYQYGPMYEYENVKAYVFARDNYTCQCCKMKAGSVRKDGTVVKLKAHHIDFRGRAATDNPERMVSICDGCHTARAHQPGGILYNWMVEGKKYARGYRDTAAMNILRGRMMGSFPDATFTYGNITAADREILQLPKSHADDAVAIAAHGMDHIRNIPGTVFHVQLRKQKRSLHEATPRKGRKGPNRLAARNRKNTCHAGGRWLNDKVSLFGQTGVVSGFSGNNSVYVKDCNGSYITVPGKTYKLVPVSKTKLITHCNNWAVYYRQAL